MRESVHCSPVDDQLPVGAGALFISSTRTAHPPQRRLGLLSVSRRANADQIAELTVGSIARVGATFASGHRFNPPFQAPVVAQELARRAAGADDADPLFLTPDQTRPATPRHVQNWLERIGRKTGLRFEATTGWNRYLTRPWATFHQLAATGLITA